MFSGSPRAKQFLLWFCLAYLTVWLYLPNIVILAVNSELALKLKSLGLLISVFCTLPILLIISGNLRQFWLWNLPFALISGFYAGYIWVYHDIPYDGIWFAIWTASTDVNWGFIQYFSTAFLCGSIGFIIYVLCIFHPVNKRMVISKSLKQYVVFSSLLLIAITVNALNFFSKRFAVQRVIDLSVISKSYPYGMLAMCMKSAISVAHHQPILLPPYKRKTIPHGREIYVFVLGEAARQDDWQEISAKMHSNLLTDPDIRIFSDAVSQANLTAFSLALIMSGTTDLQAAVNHPNWVEMAKAAGCKVGWITNSTEPFPYSYQADFYDLNFDHFGLSGITSVIYDDVLIPEVERAILQGPEKLCLVVHLIGSHFDYRERYRADYAILPVNPTAYQHWNDPEHTLAFHNAFKNSIVETNVLLQNILAILKKQDAVSVLVYTADHAESFDDHHDQQFFHGNLQPHPPELRVPFFIWANKKFQTIFPEKWSAVSNNMHRKVSNRQLVPTLMDILDVENKPTYLSPSLLQRYPHDETRWIFLPSAKVVAFDSLQ